jgi:hypothetical protein
MRRIDVTIATWMMLALGVGCGPGKGPTGPGSSNTARYIDMYNCNHTGDATSPPKGHAYNVYTRVDGGAWTPQGGLNPQPGPWTDCHDAAHEGAKIHLDLASPAGQWEIRAIILPLSGEPDCDSSAPDVANACQFRTFSYHTDLSQGTVKLDVGEE